MVAVGVFKLKFLILPFKVGEQHSALMSNKQREQASKIKERDAFLMTGLNKSNQQKRKPLKIQDPLGKDVLLCDNYS